MDLPSTIHLIEQHEALSEYGDFRSMLRELNHGLHLFWEVAVKILRGSGIELLDPPKDYFALSNNFFSALFLYSYRRAAIPPERRILYAAINQCLRGMVTGCDNILDDEYKVTLRTNLPEQAVRFRSVLDIMVSDRVLFELVTRKCMENTLTPEQALIASAASLHALTASGAQEATEEAGIDRVLEPQDVLRLVHHHKTGMLFLCPWGVPGAIENLEQGIVTSVKDALYHIGMGCQIMDDMADLRRDVHEKRHNYAASLVYHRAGPGEWERLLSMVRADRGSDRRDTVLSLFPEAREEAATHALSLVEQGLKQLLLGHHQYLVGPAIDFLCERIGTTELMRLNA